jgi:tetratricopeptide (TPR) repeat protein
MRALKSRFFSSLCAALVVSAVAGPTPAGEAGRKVYEQTLHATAWVLVKMPEGIATGSGWIADRDGKLLVTNYHVVENLDAVLVYFPAQQHGKVVAERRFYQENAKPVRGKVIDADPKRDLAVVELESLPADVGALALAAESPRIGDRVHSVGNPGASDALWVYTSGTVRQVYAAKWRFGTGQQVEARIIETQSPTNGGDSGGPLVNHDGRLIGVTSSHTTDARLMTQFIDVSEVRTFLDEARPLLRPRTWPDHNHCGNHYYQRGRFDRAVAHYTQAIRLNDGDAVLYRNRGMALTQKGDYVTGIADLDEVLRRNPKDDWAYNWRAWANHLNGDHDKAIADYTEAIRLNPKEFLYYRGRAYGYHAKSDHDRALADLKEGLRLNAKDPDLYNRRGWIYDDMGKYDDAIASYTEALKLGPSWASVVYRGRGFAWTHKRDYEKAFSDFSTALRLDPKDWAAYKGRGIVLAEAKLYKEAIADYTAAIKLYRHSVLFRLRARAYEAAGDATRADADNREAERLEAAGK